MQTQTMAAAPKDAEERPPLWPWALATALFAAAFGPALAALFQQWLTDGENSHGLLVAGVAAWLFWQRSALFRRPAERPPALGLIILSAALAGYLLARVGGMVIAQRLCLVAAVHGVVLYNFGKSVYRDLAFPLFYLFLMIPLPVTLVGGVSFPLQTLASHAAEAVLGAVGVPVVRTGHLLHLPGGILEVAEACSGLRSLLSLTSLAILFAYFTKGSWRFKAFLAFSAVPIALAANIFRVSLAGVMAHVYGMGVARGFLHHLSGYVVFLIGLAIFAAEIRLAKEIREST